MVNISRSNLTSAWQLRVIFSMRYREIISARQLPVMQFFAIRSTLNSLACISRRMCLAELAEYSTKTWWLLPSLYVWRPGTSRQ